MPNDNTNNPPIFNDPINWKSLGFFSSEDYLIYIFKKTEKITSALHLVSGLLKDNEPLKWELRDKGIDLLTSSFTASSSVPGDKNAFIQSIFTAALETLSLLNVAKVSNLVSDMNHKLLVKEIDNIVAMLKDKLAQNAENAGYVLSESFFRTSDMFASGFKNMKLQGMNNTDSNITRNRGFIDKGHTDIHKRKLQRHEAILNLLKGQSNLTIKDFSRVIKDCSEKTIQRELLELVDKGLIKKEGEKRWSKYSLK